MSLVASTGEPRTCSGDMYPTVPMTVPAPVAVRTGDAPCGSSGRMRANPKSRIFSRPSNVRKRFSGFRSRLMIPFAWAAPKPSAIAPYLHRLPPGKSGSHDAASQRCPFEQLGHDVRGALVLADVVDREDVGMIQRRGRARFQLETA